MNLDRFYIGLMNLKGDKSVVPVLNGTEVYENDSFANSLLYIGRANKYLQLEGSKWGNPFPLKRESERPQVIKQYIQHILSRQDLIDNLTELDGKCLCCYCYPKICHGNVLIELRKFQKFGVSLSPSSYDYCLANLRVEFDI